VDVNLILTGIPKSVREKLSLILSLIVENQRETGMVEERWLIKELKEKYKIDELEAKKLIYQLIKEGTIYQPRDGFLQKT